MSRALTQLRRRAIAAAFPRPTALRTALARMGFVQADPIRAPARAQDLILRHRVTNYRAGDLERLYPKLPIEEGYLHVYGFLTRPLHSLLHPRTDPALPDGVLVPQGIAAQVLDHVRRNGPTHPADLATALGTGLTLNAWGGQSQATTRALDHLQHHGLLRVTARRNGIRIYEATPQPTPATTPTPTPDPETRLARLAMQLARQLAPVPQPTLTGLAAKIARMTIGPIPRPGPVAALLKAGELESAEIDGQTYLWPADLPATRPTPTLRFLAPFDPLVWCRRRFEHLWGWEYRFEAYTPAPKRLRGYYALPLLWHDHVIGWVNLTKTPHGLDAHPGFITPRPTSPEFTQAYDQELAALETFLRGETE